MHDGRERQNTRATAGRRRSLLGRLGAALMFALAVGRGAEAHTPVHLEVLNAQANAELRCVLVLAHFVTQDVGLVAPGGSLALTFARNERDGTLTVPRDDGSRMAVEALLCGAAAQWSDSYASLPLARLGDGAVTRLRLACVLNGRVTCRPVEE